MTLPGSRRMILPPPRRRRAAAAFAALVLLFGCSVRDLPYTGVVRPHDALTPHQLERWLQIIAELPGGKLPELPNPYARPGPWDHDRTLLVDQLAEFDALQVADGWEPERVAKLLPALRALDEQLVLHGMTRAQFVGLTLSISLARTRLEVPKGADLDELQSLGERAIQALRADHRPFSSLSLEDSVEAIYRAEWIPLVELLKQLDAVHPGNLGLVIQYRERIDAVLPAEWRANPLLPYARVINATGEPFVESPGIDDGDLRWDPSTALIGQP